MNNLIKDTISDLVADFLYYDRKEDEYLRVGDIDKAIELGELNVEEIVDVFKRKLIQGLE